MVKITTYTTTTPWVTAVRALKADILSLTSLEVGLFGWMMAYRVGIWGYRLEMNTWVYWWMMQLGMVLGLDRGAGVLVLDPQRDQGPLCLTVNPQTPIMTHPVTTAVPSLRFFTVSRLLAWFGLAALASISTASIIG